MAIFSKKEELEVVDTQNIPTLSNKKADKKEAEIVEIVEEGGL